MALPQTRTLAVTGMTCDHCRVAVETALRDVPGVTAARVDLDQGTAIVEGDATVGNLFAAVQEAGYAASLMSAK